MPSKITLNWTPPPRPKEQKDKIQLVCDLIAAMDFTPKSFLTAFLESPDMAAAVERQYWATPVGIPSTIQLVKTIWDNIQKIHERITAWNDFILNEASIIVQNETPPTGYFPKGGFYSSERIQADFYNSNTKTLRNKKLVEDDMPFLFKLVTNKMRINLTPPPTSQSEVREDDDAPLDNSDTDEHKPDLFGDGPDAHRYYQQQVITTGKTICAMVAHIANRRHNRLQISNSLTFLPCGVAGRVNKYLQKRVHDKSQGHNNKMFHGTWGYLHQPNPAMTTLLSADEISLQAFKEAISKAASVEIHPKLLYGSIPEHLHWKEVIKSQIATVLLKYLIEPTDRKIPIQTTPRTVDQILHTPPNIPMLKLMVALDESSQGVSNVFHGILQQYSISEEDFYNRLQVIDADLATCKNFQSLQDLQIPNHRNEENLTTILTILGGAHTLWNIAGAIFTLHLGNSADSRDSGAWCFLDALGIPSEKPIDKKDFTLMIQNMEKIHEATICHLLMVVMGIDNGELGPKLRKLPSDKIKYFVDQCYNCFFTGSTVRKASENLLPKLSNQILRSIDFASVVKADRAMKSGDIGRVMYMWKRWSVMSQSMNKLKNYTIHLPRMVVLLEKVLPPALSKAIKHSLFIAPSGRREHFVAKDFFLESQNFWLKYIFNHTGKGTEIDWLKDIYSPNLSLLQNLIHDLKEESGLVNYHQSHKNVITLRSLNSCL
ncbi:hypothetical protein PTTG_25684 [Puccinia triticina 1-1 BBBD Race 1]|uniref:DUF6589 domain-containing protein n=1 Tax=Puccinia triticina (isolate 1-1 / race 1 (BBBD)) TaxID=630390 RepID=A0A180H048_PUCT1|nr:hypothetical protein PTTG_25684 [Puccinia triticina 1-1 BBBD Race 1]